MDELSFGQGPPKRGPPAKKDTKDFTSYFTKSVGNWQRKVLELNATAAESAETGGVPVIDSKETNALNGLETSTFTVVARVRPVLASDATEEDTEPYACIVPGPARMAKPVLPEGTEEGADGTDSKEEWTEVCSVLTPRVTIAGKPKMEKTDLPFDLVFGPDVQGEEIMKKVGMPLVTKALNGQVGVVFAYGQTGSGKTHTMNNLLSSVVPQLFASGNGVTISFSYLEILGQKVTDCLFNNGAASDATGSAPPPPPADGVDEDGEPITPLATDDTAGTADGNVRIGEMLNGEVKMLGLSDTICSSAAELQEQMTVAQARRSTAATERNATSSRSHGIAILRVSTTTTAGGGVVEGAPTPAPGVLYVIDLAGSERLADSKNHSDERMEETKAINLSLMSLKECIRARTVAGAGDGRSDVFVPYRRSKLTLLMKDVFDIGCARLCSTVVLAHVSPLVRDVKHSTNTLNYAAPLRVATRNPSRSYEKDERDPALWTHKQCAEWITSIAPSVNPEWLMNSSDTGIQLCRTPEQTFFSRVGSNGGSAEDAKAIYSKLWTLICDAKTRRRRPNGTIITAEQEEAARIADDAARAEKARIWKEREEHLKSER